MVAVLAVGCSGAGQTPGARPATPSNPAPASEPEPEQASEPQVRTPFGEIMGIAWSPDGAHIAAVDLELSARVWDATTGELRGAMSRSELRGGAPVSVGFDDTGNEVRAGATRWRFADNQQTPLLIASGLSSDWRITLRAVDDAIDVVDTETGQPVHRLDDIAPNGAELHTSTADGPIVVCGSDELTIAAATGSVRGRVAVPSGQRWERFGCSVSPQGAYAAAATNAGEFVLIDAATATIVGSLGTHTAEDANRFTRFSDDGQRVVVFQDFVVREEPTLHVEVFEVPSRRQLASVDAGRAFPALVSLTRDASRLAAPGLEGGVEVYDVASGRRLATIETEMRGQRHVALSPTGDQVAVGAGKRVSVFVIESGERVAQWTVE
ncbi:MAG: hypothetical protein AAGE52_05780 [Myxococcota bacterium]